ncbi:MAG TPA: HAMP domain-containing sensor histidine kinase, partial [Candidatus Binatia bacterium]|nr:HAMP domain-containing sensor histidine kinase [Candidatus Binatia bacterium]
MIIGRLLDWPALHGSAGATAQPGNPGGSVGARSFFSKADKNAIVAVQWLAAIGTSYLVVAVHDRDLTDPLPALVILLCLISAALLQRIPDALFERRLIEPGLLVLDSILILSAIMTSQQIPWDLLILFFFCVFIAAIGENLVQIGVGCVLLSLVFVTFISPNVVDAVSVNPNFLFRVPFMFAISIFYGHLASQVKREKQRTEKIEEAVRLKRQLVCALAHDIKTPLNVILGHAELLAEPSAPVERLSSFECIRKNVDRISKLITDFLDVSKLENLKVQGARDLVDMNAIAEEVVLQQLVTAREKNLRLQLDLDEDIAPVVGDTTQLQRALWNLVSNAIKFTPAGGTITVKSQSINKSIAIKVKDTGIGIPADEIPTLFSEFHRLRGAANTEGTGLGLFIVKTIVEGHGGEVAVESELGAGSTFSILLPSSKRAP